MKFNAFRLSTLLILLIVPASMAQDPQPCTTDPFDRHILPLCAPGGDGGGVTIGPEDLFDFVQSPNGTWQAIDVSQRAGGPQVLGAPPSAIQVGSEYHVYVPNAANGHIAAFIRNASGIWSAFDLTAAVGRSSGSSVPSAILTPNGTEHVFVTDNSHLLDFVKAPGASWTLVDVSVAVGLGSSTAFSPVGSVAVLQMGSDLHVYAFANSDLEEYFLPSGGAWVFTDVSSLTGGTQIASAPGVLNIGAAEVYVAGTNGHLLNFQGTNFTAGGGTWQVFDQTANSGGSVRLAGLPYVAPYPIVYGNSVQVFIDGGPSGVADLDSLVEVSGQWQTFDLSSISSNGQALGLVSQPFTLLDGSNVHVYVPGSGGRLLEFFKSPNANWVVTDITAATGKSPLGIGATAFRDANRGEFHVFENGAATLLPTSVTFAGQNVGTTSGSQAVTLTNNGTGPLSISSIAASGDFAETNTCPSTLPVGASCTIDVTFNPTATGPRTGTLSVTDNAAGSPQSAGLNGTGTTPGAVLSPTSLTFAGQNWGTTSAAQQITLTNNGTGPLSISSIAASGDFAQTNTCGSTLAPSVSCTINVTSSPTAIGPRTGTLSVTDNAAGSPQSAGLSGTGTTSSLRFVPVTPCRVADTRNPNGPFGGPFLSGGSDRAFAIPNSACGIPSTAQAYSVNATVVPRGPLGLLTLFPSGQPLPLASTLNSIDGRVKAVAAIVTAGANGAVAVHASDDTDFILDINGYFVPASTPAALAFYPVTPCRLVDTRVGTGPLAGPFLAGGAVRIFPILSGTCNVPSTAQAYSLNYTAVPSGILSFLTTWPAGQPQPAVSTLNAPTGAVTANAAIVQAGTNGDVAVFVTDDSDLVIDIDGYFAPPGQGGLSLFPLPPCRVVDTRNPTPTGGQPFSGTLDVNVAGSNCGAGPSAQAYVLNATVVPPGALGLLTLWNQGAALPPVSTLNAADGAVTSNMALVPTNNGSVSAFASDLTHLILDILGFFAP
jgi:uncharacterized membrane protein